MKRNKYFKFIAENDQNEEPWKAYGFAVKTQVEGYLLVLWIVPLFLFKKSTSLLIQSHLNL